jgi:anion-transporting  ArsA/GET3 family ATPase
MPSRILIFCGKGGVGKTTVSLAMALKHAAVGKRTLVVTSHPLAELGAAISLEGLGAQYPGAGKNLMIVHLDPQELLSDMVHRNFPVTAAADRVVRSAIFRNIVEIAPGLKEFYFLARLQQLAEREGESAAAAYDLMIWDAPATGHFLSTLRSARTFEHYLSGPLASAGAEVARFFSDTANVSIAPVTTLEEMAIQETIELAGELEREFRLKGRALVMNLVSPVVNAPEDELRELESFRDPALRFIFGRGQAERERAASLLASLQIPGVAIPRIGHSASDLALLGHIADKLDLPGAA